mgnify:CR=1 FL=1
MRIFIFLIVNAIGFLSAGAMIVYALHNTNITRLPPELRTEVWPYLESGTMLVWILGGVLSIAYLFIKNNARLLFLFLPIVLPLIYTLYILNLFQLTTEAA